MAKKTDKKNNNCPLDDRYSDCVAKLFNAGKAIDDICGAFPEYEDEIREFCASIEAKKAAHEKNEQEQTSILAKQNNRGREIGDKPNFGLLDPLRVVLSRRRLAVFCAVALIVLVAGNAAWLAAHSGSNAVRQTSDANSAAKTSATQPAIGNGEESDNAAPALPEPTGTIDDAVAAVNNFIGQEDAISSLEDNDVKLISADNSAIDQISSIYTINGAVSCLSLQNLTAQSQKNISDRQSSIAVAQAARLNSIIGGRNARDNHLDAQRSVTDSQLKRDFDKMSLVAEGGTQKQGVADFAGAVGAAIAARRTAVDSAQGAFRQNLDQLLAQRMTDIKNAGDAFESAGNAALAQASISCKNGDQAAISNFQNSIGQALATFNNAKSAIESRNGDPLAGARALVVKNGNDAFIAAFAKAQQDLRALQF